MIEQLTGNETPEELTLDLRERIANNNTYDGVLNYIDFKLEPYVIVTEVIDPYDNYRRFEQNGKFIIPVATYVNKTRSEYTSFDECKEWSVVYGLDNINIGIIANLIDYGEE